MQEMELEDVSYSLENEQQFWVGELPPPFQAIQSLQIANGFYSCRQN
jgi:hypothetical protein